MIVLAAEPETVTIPRATYDALMELLAEADRYAATKSCPLYLRTADAAVHTATNTAR